MSIQGPNSFFELAGTYPAGSIAPTTPVGAAASSGSSGDASSTASTVRLSAWSQVLGKLQRLHDDAPATFKVAVGQMADSVKQAADKADGERKQELQKLCQKLVVAAKCGDLSVFRPTHHHHSRHPAAAQSGSGQGTPSILQSLLDQIDHVLGPDASSA